MLYKEMGFTEDGVKEDKLQILRRNLRKAAKQADQDYHLKNLQKEYNQVQMIMPTKTELLKPG